MAAGTTRTMNTPDKNADKNSDKHDELRQQLWELAYGLLEPEAEAAVRAQIKSDPAIARLYSEVRLQADLVGTAARVQDSSLHVVASPDAKVTKVEAKKPSKHPSRKSQAVVETQGWSTNWLAVGGTVALLLLLAFGLYLPQHRQDSLAAFDYYSTEIIAPANTPAGVSQTVQLKTVSIDERGRPAEVALRVVDPQGNETFRKQIRTDENGLGAVDLPGSVMQRGYRVEAVPQGKDSSLEHNAGEVVSAKLQVVAEPKQTLMITELPRASAGETVGYSETQLGLFSKRAELPPTEDLVMESTDGRTLATAKSKQEEIAGVVNGQFEIPTDPTAAVKRFNLRRSAAAPKDLAENTPRAFGYSEPGKELQARGPGRGGMQANGSAQGGGVNAGAGLRGSPADAQRSLAPGEIAPQQPAPSGEGRSAKFGSLQHAEANTSRGVAPANPAAANAPPPPAPAPSLSVPTPAPAAPGSPSLPAADPSAAGPSAVVPAPRAMPAPGGPRTEVAGAPSEGGARPAGDAGVNNRKNAANEITDKGANGNLGAAKPGDDRPAPEKLATEKSIPDKSGSGNSGAGSSGTVLKQLADPQAGVARAMKPKAEQMKDERPPKRDALAEERPADKGPTADQTQNQIADGRPLEQKAQPAAIGAAVAADSQELRQLQFPQELLGKPAVLVARQHGLEVFHREIAALQESDHFVELPPEVEGRVEVELYRPGDAARPVYRQQIVRTAARTLRFDVKGLQDSYVPGEKVKLQVGVRDELGNPVAATVGVRVWNEVAAREVNGPLLLVDMLEHEPDAAPQEFAKANLGNRALAMRAAPVIRNPGGFGAAPPAAAQYGAVPALPPAQQPSADSAPAPGAAPETPALKRSAEEEETRRERGAAAPFHSDEVFLEQQPATTGESSGLFFVNQNVVADNRAIVEHEYEAAKAAKEAERFAQIQTVGRLLLWAGAGLMLLIAILLVARRPLKSAVWIPAVGVAALSLALGLAWFVPERPTGHLLARLEEQPAAADPQAVQPQAVPLVVSPAKIDDLESAQMRDLVNHPLPVDAPQAIPATLPIAPTAPAAGAAVPAPEENQKQLAPAPPAPNEPRPRSFTGGGAGAGGGFSGGVESAPLPKPGMAMRAKTDAPDGNDPTKRQPAKNDAARKQESEQLAMEKVAEAKKAESNEPSPGPSPNPAAKPGETTGAVTDKAQADLTAAANALQARQAERALRERPAGATGKAAAPDSIYWRPLKPTASDGSFTIEFTMPAVESEYRMLLDAVGDGRMGGQQQLLICREKK